MRSAETLNGAVRRLLATTALAMMACTTPTIDAAAPPYDPTALTAGLLYHWPTGRTLDIHVLGGGASPLLDATVRTAASRWTSALAFREHTLRLVDRPEQADILVRDAAIGMPVDTAGCGGARWTESFASTLFCPAGDTARTLSLVNTPGGHAKVLITIDLAGVGNPTDLLPIVVHEIGHALGIGGHSSDPADVMFAAPAVPSPSPADARTLRYVLHRRPHLTL